MEVRESQCKEGERRSVEGQVEERMCLSRGGGRICRGGAECGIRSVKRRKRGPLTLMLIMASGYDLTDSSYAWATFNAHTVY